MTSCSEGSNSVFYYPTSAGTTAATPAAAAGSTSRHTNPQTLTKRQSSWSKLAMLDEPLPFDTPDDNAKGDPPLTKSPSSSCSSNTTSDDLEVHRNFTFDEVSVRDIMGKGNDNKERSSLPAVITSAPPALRSSDRNSCPKLTGGESMRLSFEPVQLSSSCSRLVNRKSAKPPEIILTRSTPTSTQKTFFQDDFRTGEIPTCNFNAWRLSKGSIGL